MDYPTDVDLVWLAADDTGRLAAMITGGAGPIPGQVLANNADEIFGVEQALHGLRPISAGSIHVQVPNPQSFEALSEKGLFVYDWTDVHRSLATAVGAYELVASPSVCIDLADLPNGLSRLIAPLNGSLRLGALRLKVS